MDCKLLYETAIRSAESCSFYHWLKHPHSTTPAALISHHFDNSCTVFRENCSRCYSNTGKLGRRGLQKEKFAPAPTRFWSCCAHAFAQTLCPEAWVGHPIPLRLAPRTPKGSGARMIESVDGRDAGAPICPTCFPLRYSRIHTALCAGSRYGIQLLGCVHRAATWSSVWYLLSAFAVISYTKNWAHVGFAAAGSWVGAFLSMTLLRRPLKIERSTDVHEEPHW